MKARTYLPRRYWTNRTRLRVARRGTSPPASGIIDHVRLVGVAGFGCQLGPANSIAARMDQLQQTLEAQNPAKSLGAVADCGLEPAAQLSFAEIDRCGQFGYRPMRPLLQ